MDGDEQCGKLQLPVLHHEMEQMVWFGVIGDSDVLQEEEEDGEEEEDDEEQLLVNLCG